MFKKQIFKEFHCIIIYNTILHSGCESRSSKVVEYILFLNKIDINGIYEDIIIFIIIEFKIKSFNGIQNQIF